MPKAYSEDLRWRAVWLALVRGMNSYEIGYVLFMSEASVYTTGAITPKEHSSGPKKMLGEFEQFTVLQTLIHRPTSYLHEVQRDLLSYWCMDKCKHYLSYYYITGECKREQS